jgi:hypothetical protein
MGVCLLVFWRSLLPESLEAQSSTCDTACYHNRGLGGETVEKQALSRLDLFNVLHHKCDSAVKMCGNFKLLWYRLMFLSTSCVVLLPV